ncbi:MAG: hypothetical protein JJ863_18255 [Deltaproteobacteria bacterium]|nr:hypothetical protein [Deltaproteobacteria bacterium]
MRTLAHWLLPCALLALASPGLAHAERPLPSLAALKEACQEARVPGRRALYVVELESFRFGRSAEDGFLPVDTRRNLQAFGGAAALFPSELEPIGFRASAERQSALREARRAGAKLRVGFFLGFDGEGQPCVIRAAVSVSTIRMDVAFLELVDSRGRVIARDDTERLRAWRDDEERDRVPGEGPRVAVDDPWGSAAPVATVTAIRALAPRLGQCHAAHVARGGPESGRALVQLTVEGGALQDPTFAFSTFSDERFGACVLRVLKEAHLPMSSGRMTVPLRFAAD